MDRINPSAGSAAGAASAAGAVTPRVITSPPLQRVLRPFREFAQVEASGGLVLLACTLIALAWANSPWAASYEALWHTEATLAIGAASLSLDLRHWVNDALMALFFFVVGLEIKREVLAGELAGLRRAALPVAAAVGGMVAPALLYIAVTRSAPAVNGWGIPMATDIAFALGVLALLGSRAPLGLKVFLTALAIVDDIGAVLVIALVYTTTVSWGALLIGFGGVALLLGANLLGARSPLVYALGGLVVWGAFLHSGVHASIAGVLVSMTVPAWVRLDTPAVLARLRDATQTLSEAQTRGASVLNDEVQRHALLDLEAASESAQAPMQRLEHALHPWVSFVIMPLFALANAGVALDVLGGEAASAPGHLVAAGVAAGLLLGKPLGITVATWVAVRARLCALPAGVTWRHVHGAGWLGGIGFTMSLFIAGLAFGQSDLLPLAKAGILTASSLAGVVGFLLLRSTR